MPTLHDLNHALATTAATARAATVRLGRDGRASGVVVADGVVLANAHALRDRTISVTFVDGRTAQATVHGTDLDGDLVALLVDTTGATPLAWADDEPSAGHLVVAAHGDGSVAVGNVSATNRRFPGPRGRSIANAIEHTASLARGASGGPVVDVDGRLVAINTNRTEAGYQAISVVGPARSRIQSLLAGRSFHRRQLGVALAPADVTTAVRRAAGLPDVRGLLVRNVADASPAQRAGIAVGDVIVEAGGIATGTLDELAQALDSPDEQLALAVVRGVDRRDVTVSFADTPTDTPPDTAPGADNGTERTL